MLRLLGHVIPDNKSIWIGLTFIYGIGRALSRKILDKLNIPFMKKVADISFEEEKLISDYLKDMVLENDLRREVQTNIKRLKEIKCYRGMRHNLGLPVRGQNTKKNAKTAMKLLGRARVRPILKK
ncbi:MAG: 30S ribosomal protein S13 [Candidatus Absconditabacterales bacterium]|nr:30S ribosomal protein S13 [Candidatus Absconditabacterales bacterium]